MFSYTDGLQITLSYGTRKNIKLYTLTIHSKFAIIEWDFFVKPQDTFKVCFPLDISVNIMGIYPSTFYTSHLQNFMLSSRGYKMNEGNVSNKSYPSL